jgi:hypothetical protein
MIISSSSLKQLVAGELGEPWDEMAAQPVSNSTLHRQASVCALCQQGRKALRQALIPEPNIRPEGRRGPVPEAHGGDGLINREEGTVGNSGKPVTLETLSLTKFSKHVFQE